jgi:hypothetical protein
LLELFWQILFILLWRIYFHPRAVLGLDLAQDVPLDQILPLQLLDLVGVADDLVDLGLALPLLLPLLVLLNALAQLLLLLNFGLQ